MYTRHGHQIPGTPVDAQRPATPVARCGGIPLCPRCHDDYKFAHHAEIDNITDLVMQQRAGLPPFGPTNAIRKAAGLPDYEDLQRRVQLSGEADETMKNYLIRAFEAGELIRMADKIIPPKPFDGALPMDKARLLVYEVVQLRLEKTDTHVEFEESDVYVVWFCKTLQNWKALVSTTLPDGKYYEVTYNGDKRETYIDTYVKLDNITVSD